MFGSVRKQSNSPAIFQFVLLLLLPLLPRWIVLAAPQQSHNEHSLPWHGLFLTFFLWQLSSANVLRFLFECPRFLLGSSPSSTHQREEELRRNRQEQMRSVLKALFVKCTLEIGAKNPFLPAFLRSSSL